MSHGSRACAYAAVKFVFCRDDQVVAPVPFEDQLCARVSTVISCDAWGMALQNPVRLTPITRSVGAAASSAALVPRSEELLSAPATIAASISMIGRGASCSLQVFGRGGRKQGSKSPGKWRSLAGLHSRRMDGWCPKGANWVNI